MSPQAGRHPARPSAVTDWRHRSRSPPRLAPLALRNPAIYGRRSPPERGRASSSDSQRVLAAKPDRHAGQRRRRRPAKLVNGLRPGVDDGEMSKTSIMVVEITPACRTDHQAGPGGDPPRRNRAHGKCANPQTPRHLTRDIAPGPSPHPPSQSRPCRADQAPSDAPRQAQRAVPVTCGLIKPRICGVESDANPYGAPTDPELAAMWSEMQDLLASAPPERCREPRRASPRQMIAR